MKQILTLSFLFVSIVTFAQPTYDDCPAFDLGIAPFCDDVLLFNNVNATESDIGFDNFPCPFHLVYLAGNLVRVFGRPMQF